MDNCKPLIFWGVSHHFMETIAVIIVIVIVFAIVIMDHVDHHQHPPPPPHHPHHHPHHPHHDHDHHHHHHTSLLGQVMLITVLYVCQCHDDPLCNVISGWRNFDGETCPKFSLKPSPLTPSLSPKMLFGSGICKNSHQFLG